MKNKPVTHQGKVQLIDASACCSARRKNIGSKNVDITKVCRDLIIKAYGAYVDGTYNGVDENEHQNEREHKRRYHKLDRCIDVTRLRREKHL